MLRRRRAGMETLVLTHYVPPFPTGAGDDWRALAAEHFDSTIQLGDDLHRMTVTARPAHPHVCMGNDEQKG
jgi:ribonuclease Z